MGLVTYTTPGTQVTQAEYDANFTTLYDEFNGNIDNNNIKATAGIVDTKLATIATAGKVLESALPASYASMNITGTATLTGSVNLTGFTGVDYGDGTDTGNDIITMNVATGTPKVSWGVTEDRFIFSKGIEVSGAVGIDIAPGSNTSTDLITVNVTGTPLLKWDNTNDRFEINKGLELSSGNITLAGTVDGVDVSAHDIATTGVHGAGANTLATDADITTHAGLTTGMHGVGGSTVASVADITTNITTHSNLSNNTHGVGNDASISVGAVIKGSATSLSLTAGWNTITINIASAFTAGAGTKISGMFYSVAVSGEEDHLTSVLLSTTQSLAKDGTQSHSANQIVVRVNVGFTRSDYAYHYQITK